MNWNLVADIGGTNARFAVARAGLLEQSQTFATSLGSGENTLLANAARFVEAVGSPPGCAVVAAAGVVADGQVTLTNSDQTLTESELAALTSGGEARIVNDFEAAAWSLVSVQPDDVSVLQGDTQMPYRNRLILGPGTGLGVGALVHGAGHSVVVPGEGGHVGICPNNAADAEVFAAYAQLWPQMQIGDHQRFEAEAFLSGTGLPFLYRAVCQVTKVTATLKTNEQILQAARDNTNSQASRTTELFITHLGQVAGDLALVFGAFGGVFITGGVALANRWLFGSHFLQAFNEGGRYTTLRSQIPVYLYTQPQFGLIGAMNAAERLFSPSAGR